MVSNRAVLEGLTQQVPLLLGRGEGHAAERGQRDQAAAGAGATSGSSIGDNVAEL